MICKHIFRYAKSNDQTVLFLTIHLNISQELNSSNIGLNHKQFKWRSDICLHTALFQTIQISKRQQS